MWHGRATAVDSRLSHELCGARQTPESRPALPRLSHGSRDFLPSVMRDPGLGKGQGAAGTSLFFCPVVSTVVLQLGDRGWRGCQPIGWELWEDYPRIFGRRGEAGEAAGSSVRTSGQPFISRAAHHLRMVGRRQGWMKRPLCIPSSYAPPCWGTLAFSVGFLGHPSQSITHLLLKTTAMDFVLGMEVRGPKFRCWQLVLSGGSRGESVMGSSYGQSPLVSLGS